MNGSYSVPIGSSRSPLIACDRPSADSRMNRFISAMPSSMCWPFGENSQAKVEGMRSFLNVSGMHSRANSPRRFTQAPRLVETVTSGEVVTMRDGECLFRLADLVHQRAETGLRRCHGLAGDRYRSGISSAAPSPRGLRCANGTGREMPARLRRQRQAFEAIPFVAGAHCSACGRFPSAPASSGPRDCPCARPSAGRSPSPCSR